VISVSIVTYNSGAVIGRCLASLAASLDPDQPIEVTVVDNGSADDTLKIVTEFIPQTPSGLRMSLLRAPENLGYGRAHNLAIANASTKYHVICNPDIIFRENTLKTLGDYLDQHSDVGIVCPAVLNEDLTPQHLNKRLPTVLDLFLRRFLPQVLTPVFRKRLDRYEMKDVGYDRIVDVPFVSGAFLFCRLEALRRVGGFDSRYFLYFEDVDLSRSVQLEGYRTVYLPTTSVVHLWARAAHKSPWIAMAFIRNGLRYFGKWGVDLW
jgi:GT2 family glycosyltransferase